MVCFFTHNAKGKDPFFIHMPTLKIFFVLLKLNVEN